MATSSPAFDLARLFSPVGESSFFREHWEKQPVVMRREPGWYASLLTPAGYQALLGTEGLRAPFVSLAISSSRVPIEQFTTATGAIDRAAVAAAYDKGTTSILSYADQICDPLGTLCRELESRVGRHVWAYVFNTPPHSQGLPACYDVYDVFALQLSGSEHFRIRKPVRDLPLRNQLCKPGETHKSEVLEEHVLREGDLLYIPRGHVYEVFTKESPGMHARVIVFQHTWRDLLATALPELLDSVAREDIRFRRSHPLGAPEVAAGSAESPQAYLAELLGILSRKADLASFASRAEPGKLLGQPPPRVLATVDPKLLESLSATTRVRLKPGLDAQVGQKGNLVTIDSGGFRVMGPKQIEPCLRYIVKAGEFTAESLPGTMPVTAKLVLVRRLLKDGFLAVTEA